MKDGSKITGHIIGNVSGSSNYNRTTVYISGGTTGKFTMEGGEISDNGMRTGSSQAAFLSAVCLDSGTFEMKGGTITGTINGTTGTTTYVTPTDVFIGYPASATTPTNFLLSGNAHIGGLTVQRNNSAAIGRVVAIKLAGVYTGAVDALHLNCSGLNATNPQMWVYINGNSNYPGNPIITGDGSYTPTATDIGKFSLGRFLPTSNPLNPSNSPLIASSTDATLYPLGLKLETTGANIGKLVPVTP